MKKEKSRIYNSMAQNLRDKLAGRKYSLGIDPGVGSIGCAVVALEEGEDGNLFATDIVYANSRVFKSSEGAQERRLKRGMRNSIRHKAHRLKKLWGLLASMGMMLPVSDKEVENPAELRFSSEMLKRNPYELRLKGLTEELSLEEIGVALYHIANHRGASSVRVFADESRSKDEDREIEQCKASEEFVRKYHLQTFIEVLEKAKEESAKNGEAIGYRNKTKFNSVPIPTRDIIGSEVDALLACQKKFHPEVLTDENIEKIKEHIFFENDKIVPEPKDCPYFKDEKCLPKASFINEERRLWEALNNVRIVYPKKGMSRAKEDAMLSKEEKEILFDYLRSGKELDGLRKVQNLLNKYDDAEDIKLQGTTKKTAKIKGFRFRKLEAEQFWGKFSVKDQDDFIRAFVNIPDDGQLVSHLCKRFGFSKDEAKRILKDTTCLVQGYAPVGRKAMEILMPYIKDEGLSYKEAEGRAINEGKLIDSAAELTYDFLPYYGVVLPAHTQDIAGKAWHSAFEERRKNGSFISPLTNRDEERFGKIANPVVHQTLNELRKLVNEIISIFGYKPTSITVELGRELKLGKEAREELSKDNVKKNKENQRIYETYCYPNQLGRKYIKVFKLLEQQENKCPYCLGAISVDQVAHGGADLDHIFPRADYPDSSENNLVVAHKNCNAEKGKRIPSTAFSDTPKWKDIIAFVDSTPGMSRKAWRFKTTQEQYVESLRSRDFFARFKTDNSFAARITIKYLQSLYLPEDRLKSVISIRGGETALLRKAWNLNGVTSVLGALHEIVKEDQADKKDRADVRHHALDAIVAAYYTHSFKKMIGTAQGKGDSLEELITRLPIPKYYRSTEGLSQDNERDAFRQTVKNFITYNAYASFKSDNSTNGQLIKDTQYSVVAANDKALILVTKKLTKNLSVGMGAVKTLEGNKSGSVEYALMNYDRTPEWVSPEEHISIDKMIAHNKKQYEAIVDAMGNAEQELVQENIRLEADGKRPKAIDEKMIVGRACSIIGGFYYQIKNNDRRKIFLKRLPSAEEKGSGFDTGSSYCVDFYHDNKGKLRAEIIRKVNICTKGYIPQYVKEGYMRIERLFPKDVLEVDSTLRTDPNKIEPCSVKTPNAPTDRTFIRIATFTENGNGVQVWFNSLYDAKDSATNGSFMVGSLSKLNARKVTLTPAGLILYRSPIIK